MSQGNRTSDSGEFTPKSGANIAQMGGEVEEIQQDWSTVSHWGDNSSVE